MSADNIYGGVVYGISLNAHFLKSMLATRMRIQTCNFITIIYIAKLRTPSCSADVQLSNGANNSFLTKCGR